jgi:hypothetical protein
MFAFSEATFKVVKIVSNLCLMNHKHSSKLMWLQKMHPDHLKIPDVKMKWISKVILKQGKKC